jgi:hypothetical protein
LEERGTMNSADIPLETVWTALGPFLDTGARLSSYTSPSLLTWSGASRMISSLESMSQAELNTLRVFYNRSTERLFPLSDPLSIDFLANRQLFTGREEVYSDWLQWVLQQLSSPPLIGRVIGYRNLTDPARSQEPINVRREIGVEHGNPDHEGRVDIILEQHNQPVAVIEVKTRPYADVALEKHAGYRKSFDAPGIEFFLLAPDPPEGDARGFKFISWTIVCQVLRGIARTRLAPEQILSTAIILAFVGAVEQNFLGFISPEADERPLGSVPRTLDYLTRVDQME